ncbi:MAG: hypothetical protein ETSY2_27960 [Candidatus Entotheonella gemina]|uniref:Conserved hypothetical protein CHP02391 domain-containing protein n=1 Tax=Candidatus Entotheonella gemina TaxID=1429439 RepID=W4M3P7_9BACT|nr:MAG: hypothetical protein ETSY2_27960 [Candidatus Entotheonella gemina]
MTDEALSRFAAIARRAYRFNEGPPAGEGRSVHPFDERNVHPDIAKVSQQLFDDGHYAQATFEAYKFIDKKVQILSKSSESGVKLMMKAFSEKNPQVQLTALKTQSEKDEQEGYKFMFSGSIMAIRNPRGHEPGMKETPTECLDHLSLASMLLRRIEQSKGV